MKFSVVHAAVFVEPTKKPCSDCPFRRRAAPGWLGASSPEGFLDCIQREEPLPCHQTIDYDDKRWLTDWMRQRDTGLICAGSLIFMANKVQRPHSPGFPTLPRDLENVFANAVEFVRYHREAAVHSWDDDDQTDGARYYRGLIANAAKQLGAPIVDYKNRSPRKKSPRKKSLTAHHRKKNV